MDTNISGNKGMFGAGSMSSEQRWQALVQTGAGTPMGDLLRRYWWPVAGVSEFDHTSVKPIRLLGENLVLYRDLSGTYGLHDRRCLHRCADLAFGYVEKHGLRCNYHGWLYDESGQCVERPFEKVANKNEERNRQRLQLKAYPVAVLGQLIWAYLGPHPAPLVPNWEFFGWPNGFRQIVISEIPCNWFQCQENSIDPVHFEWTHSNWDIRLKGQHGPYAPTHTKLAFSEFEYGFQYKRIRSDTDENDRFWTTGRVCLWPNGLFTGGHVEFRVPIDDENTLSFTWHFSRVPKDCDPYLQEMIPTWYGPVREGTGGRWITSHIMNQDIATWVGQGTVTDRAREHLGRSDLGVVMLRRRFFTDLELVKQGKDPKAVIRDVAENKCIRLPVAERHHVVDGLTREEFLKDPICAAALKGYMLQAGQPAKVRAAFLEAMGFTEANATVNDQPVDILARR